MSASSDEGRGLAHGVIGSARVIAFGLSSVAPAGSVAAGLVILVSYADLLLAAGEVAVIAALAITILVKTGPAHYTGAVFSPASSPHGQFSDITNAMILHPRAYTLVNLLPFAALGWLCLGVIAAGALRAKRPANLVALGRVFTPADEQPADAPR